MTRDEMMDAIIEDWPRPHGNGRQFANFCFEAMGEGAPYNPHNDVLEQLEFFSDEQIAAVYVSLLGEPE